MPRPSDASKTSNLEQKLDGILQLLQSSQAAKDGSMDFARHELAASSRAATSDQSSTRGTSSPTYISGSMNNEKAVNSVFTPPSSLDMERLSKGGKASLSVETVSEMQDCLDLYRTKMVPIFPVVAIGSEETVLSMQENRPFLWLVVRTVASRDIFRQIALEKEVRLTIAHQMIIEGIRSVDLLQGILAFCSWCHQYMVPRPVLGQTLQLGMSLISDLALDKPVLIPADQDRGIWNINSSGCPRPQHLVKRGPRTLEERRALVGMFLLSSM
jgi:hypothetical protein